MSVNIQIPVYKYESGLHRHSLTLATLITTAIIITSPANVLAQTDSQRIHLLEEKLEQALRVIETLQEEVNELKQRQPAKGEVALAPENPPSPDERIQDLEERIEETEELVSIIDERVGSRAVVNAFDASDLNIGGFVDLATTHANGADSSATSFNRQVFEVLVSAELGEYWDLFVAQAFVRKTAPDFSDRQNPDFADINNVATDTVLAWADYRHNEMLNLQLGRFITPHGIINIEHFPALLLDPEQPQFLRPFIGQTMFPNFTDGFQMHGMKYFGTTEQNDLSYNIYTGNFAGNATDFNYGGRIAYRLGSSGLTFGANMAKGTRTDQFDSDYYLYGADILFDNGAILWKNEVFVTDEDRGNDRFAFYTQPAWRVDDHWTLFYRFDYLDAGSNPVSLLEIGESTENVLGISFRPNPNVHLRNIWTYKSFDSTNLLSSEDSWLWQFSATLSF